MTDGQPPTVLKLAEGLRDDEIHLWTMPHDHAAGRAPLRQLLGRYLGCAAEQVVLTDAAHGRPELAGPHREALRFNWSHSGGRALVAIARHVQPGIDLEHRQRRGARDVLALAQRFFAPQEVQALRALPAADRALAFLRLWTLKEALLKAEGRGLAYGLHRVVLELGESAPVLREFGDESLASWQLQELSLEPEWVSAIAWRGPPMQLRWRGGFG